MANKKDLNRKKKKQELGGEQFKAYLLKDDNFKKYRNIVKSIKDKINVDDIDDEIMRLHSGRILRTLKGTSPGAEKIQSAALQDSSHRSRLAEIRVRVTKQADLLELTIEATRIYLAREFKDELPDIRTKGERVSFLNTYLARGIDLHSQLEALLSRIDTIIKDIDQGSFTLRHCIDLLTLVYSHNNNKVKA